MKENKSDISDLKITYGIAIISMIAAFGLSAVVIAGVIGLLANTTINLPGIFGIMPAGGAVSLIVSGGLALFAAILAKLALTKISTSAKAGDLVNSDFYTMTNKTAKAFCVLLAGVAAVMAVGILIAAILTISRSTPWKFYLLAQILPLLFIAGAMFVAMIIINKFIKAELKPAQITMILLITAAAVLAVIAVVALIKTHTAGSSSYEFDSLLRSVMDY